MSSWGEVSENCFEARLGKSVVIGGCERAIVNRVSTEQAALQFGGTRG
jgi:hypothetical protein